MAKAKKTTKAKVSKRAVKKTAAKSVLHEPVDNKLSILLIVTAILIFVLAATSMGR